MLDNAPIKTMDEWVAYPVLRTREGREQKAMVTIGERPANH